MESSRNIFLINHHGTGSTNNVNDARAIWNPSRIADWSSTSSSSSSSNPLFLSNNNDYSFHQATCSTSTAAAEASGIPPQGGGGGGESLVHALMVKANHPHLVSPFSSCLYSGGPFVGGGVVPYPDPHLMCLKLGKRHYFGDGGGGGGDRQVFPVGLSSINDNSKRGKSWSPSSSGVTVAAAAPPTGMMVAVPRCQVDGCRVALLDAKEYHRRHKVCEMHSKAPKVIVLGLEQRFCQQCSRFHAVGEFDESKRSCRRRLAGHNERRRKGSQDQPTPRNQSHQGIRKLMNYGGMHPQFPLSNNSSNGCALSLLSSKNDSRIISSAGGGDLPARCSAALRDLIAENRAAVVAQQLIRVDHLHRDDVANVNVRENGSTSSLPSYHHHHHHQQQQIGATDGGSNVTLDLMQAPPSSAFGLLSVRGKSKGDEDPWGSFG